MTLRPLFRRAIPDDQTATVRALERRVAELERTQHGHCTLCGKVIDSPYLERCHDTVPCVGKAKTA